MMFKPNRVNIASFMLILLLSTQLVQSQEINFGSYSSSYGSVTVTEDLGTDLNFGILIQGQENVIIDINNANIFSITGNKYLDVIVEINAPTYMQTLGCANVNCQIPFTLNAAYNNRSTNVNQAVGITLLNNSGGAQFPIKYRGNAPPGPPPTPVYEGYNPQLPIYQETAYLYFYATILNVGSAIAGSYSAQVDITVTYD